MKKGIQMSKRTIALLVVIVLKYCFNRCSNGSKPEQLMSTQSVEQVKVDAVTPVDTDNVESEGEADDATEVDTAEETDTQDELDTDDVEFESESEADDATEVDSAEEEDAAGDEDVDGIDWQEEGENETEN